MIDPKPASELRLVDDGLEVSGVVVPLRAARFPYWEIGRNRWAAALEALAGLRVPLVRVDVPWSLHQPARGVSEWGERRPELALEELLELLHARNLLALVCPGPWLGVAAPHGGLPPHLAAFPDALARDSRGREMPLPACASERFWSEARVWLESVAKRLERFVYPHGPLAARCLGGVGPVPSHWGGGLLDYSDSALGFFSSFARVKYPPALEPVGRPALDGPHDTAAIEHALAWVEAGEAAQRAAVGRAVAAFGLEQLPLVVDVADEPPGAGLDARAVGPVSGSAVLMQLGAGGARDFAELRRVGMRSGDLEPLGGVAALPVAEPLFGCGREVEPWFAASVVCMSGARALCIEPLWARADALEAAGLVSRDTAADVDADVAERWRSQFRALDAIEHHRLRRHTDCLLVRNRELARLREACSVSGALPAGLAPPRALDALRIAPRPLDGDDRPELDGDAAFDALFDGLRRAGIAFGVADSSFRAERLARERVAIIVSFGRMGRALVGQLFDWADAGGTLVIGPRLPVCDWSGGALGLRLGIEVKQRLSRLRVGDLALDDVDLLVGGDALIEVPEGVIATVARFGSGRVVCFGFRPPWGADPDGLARLVHRLLRPLGVAPCYSSSDPRVETELWQGEVRRFLFLANPTRRECRVEVELAPDEALREVRGHGEYVRPGERVGIPARSVILRELVSL